MLLFLTRIVGTAKISEHPFSADGHDIVLIDTPGFNDTLRSESEVLKDIAGWLEKTFKRDTKLSGIIYIQNIVERRMYGSTLRNLKMFRNLCGEDALKNVILVTSSWGMAEKLGRMEMAKRNERQLKEDPQFWQPLIEMGSSVDRFDDSRSSALKIILRLVRMMPATLQIQDELVNQSLAIAETTAGSTVMTDMKELEEKYKAEILEAQQQTEQAIRDGDLKLQRALEQSRLQLENMRDSARNVQDELRYQKRNNERYFENRIHDLNHHMNRSMEDLRSQMEAYERELREKVGGKSFEEVVTVLKSNEEKLRPEEREAVQTEIDEARKQKPSRKRDLAVKMLLNVMRVVGPVALAVLGFPVGFSGGLMDLFQD